MTCSEYYSMEMESDLLIVNKRSKTLQHMQLEAVLNRLSSEKPIYNEVHEHLLKQSAGHFGETTLDFYLQYLPEHFHVAQDIRLFDGIHYFQIDALVICPDFILILEVKNFKGELTFDLEWNQLSRVYNGQKDIFPDPFLQVEHQTRQLTRWLERFSFPSVPIYSFIVISNPYTTIAVQGQDPANLKKRIVRPKNLLTKMESISQHFSECTWLPKEFQKLIHLIEKENLPYQAAIMDRYSLSINDLIIGVQCEQCQAFPMRRRHGRWFCPSCSYISKNSHIKTLRDYQLLVKNTISNREFREFAFIHSKKVARTLLLDVCHQYTGDTKDRKYVLDLV
ncbi:nuclease-related domain-containing protein [Halobacillus amylolyticus]|uniref:NERD domain-containing protein n=1 Tax=Halobacillus amylolyticus TaxID=2932259 RepID=A0ABY4H762_9BACI|nr:nuclease-related domain-containing protein [Halobacillus amylolyticus]UOR10366.1 NERD domain-containing protein [Halobacillus amylolyticus]